MSDMEDKYISLLTDFGFKRIFGTDLNKDLLIGFLNALFEGEHVITDVKYLNSEHLGEVLAERFIPPSPSANKPRRVPTGISGSITCTPSR